MENKKFPHEKKPLYYTEKKFNFVRVFFKNLYTLFTFDFTTAKKRPSIIQRKIQVLLMCFERKFTNYFEYLDLSFLFRLTNHIIYKTYA